MDWQYPPSYNKLMAYLRRMNSLKGLRFRESEGCNMGVSILCIRKPRISAWLLVAALSASCAGRRGTDEQQPGGKEDSGPPKPSADAAATSPTTAATAADAAETPPTTALMTADAAAPTATAAPTVADAAAPTATAAATTATATPTASTGPEAGLTSLESFTLPDFPHEIDVYAVSGATRAIVMLHGGGGTSHLSANDLHLNTTEGSPTAETVDWGWLTEHNTTAVFPQGQAISGAPNAFTWDNHVMESGQDDVAFLKALAKYVLDEYGVAEVYLMGHSNGAMMTNRMWCDSPQTFDGYVAISGPASEYYLDSSTPCAPSAAKPYFAIVGSADNVIGAVGNWEANTWEVNPLLAAAGAGAFIDPTLIGEWQQDRVRSQQMCGETLALDEVVVEGATETWIACGSKLMIQRVTGGGHPIGTIEDAAGYRMLDVVADFLDGL
jgi:polyhydroxybutyrate depolymerase